MPFQYDPFQKQSIDHIREGCSVIVSAPTGAGKTVIAEFIIRDCLVRGDKVIYTAPIKALSNQKFRDFTEEFGDKVGILTGDVSINPDAPALIMTTEIFRNKILEEKSSLHEYTWIIFDEIHYIDDDERGSVWEESLIFLPDHMNVLGLSATIPNIDELSEWLQSIHKKPVKIIQEKTRPVPLHFFYQCQDVIYDDFKKLMKEGFRSQTFGRNPNRRVPRYEQLNPNRAVPLIEHLNRQNMLPCIYFVFSRRRTESLAQEMIHFDFCNAQEKSKIISMFDELCKRFDLVNEESAIKLRPFVEKGIAYHHAGMLPTLKEIVERLFTSRLIKVIFTTETFALGINMPARSVVIDEMSKYQGFGYGLLKTRDLYQMAGRAGRRGIDPEGFVFCRVNPHDCSSREIQEVVFNEPEKVVSKFNASYATILNLYQKYNEKLYDVYPLSFHFFQERKHGRKKAIENLRAKVAILKDFAFIRKNKLTEKGLFAAKVYGYEMILSEMYLNGILEKLTEMELGVLCMAVVFEPRKGTRKPALKGRMRDLETETIRFMDHVHRMERKYRISPRSKACAFHLTYCLEGWLKGEDFGKILQYTDADEGEIVRYFRMTIQVLREMREAPISDQCRQKMNHLVRMMNRDVIDSEKQLRA
jgi:superfamily II RNA helicase